MNRVAYYTTGLLMAMALTITAFGLVLTRTITASTVIITIILALAMVQLAVQLVFFLHLGQSEDSKWNTVQFCFTFGGVLVVVLASVWIMTHLNYNMTPKQIQQYINDQSTF